jgi:hypothetical protein
VDLYLSETRDREVAKCFLRRALANPDNRAPCGFARDRLRSYLAAIRELQNEGHLRRRCRHRTRRYSNNRIESDHRHIKAALSKHARPADPSDGLRGDCRNRGGADDLKGQVLGIPKRTYMGRPGYSAICSVSINTATEATHRTAVPFNAVATLPAGRIPCRRLRLGRLAQGGVRRSRLLSRR